MKKNKTIIPWLLVLLIGTFMVLDLAFVHLSVKSYSGTYTDNHFQKGVDFDKVYKSGLYNDKTGWKSNITVTDTFDKIIFTLSDSQGQPINDATVKAKVLRPVTSKHDKFLELTRVGNGRYESPIVLDFDGQWEIRVKAIKELDEYVSTIRINIK